MRFAWLKVAVLVVAMTASAGAQTNPHTQIRWPPNCSDNNYMTYNYLSNTCILVGPVGASGQVQVNQSGAWGVVPGLTYDFVTNTFSAPNISVPGNVGIGTTTPTAPLDVNGLIKALSMTAAGAVQGQTLIPAGLAHSTTPVCVNGAGGSLINDPTCVVPPAQVSWPPSCGTGVYVPASNTCVPPGTAANPAGSLGNLQMNGGGVFAPVPGVNTDNANGLAVQGIVAAAGGANIRSAPLIEELPNNTANGTVLNELVCMTGSAQAQPCGTTAAMWTGIAVGGSLGTTSGNTLIARSGQAACLFDGTTAIGHYVTISTVTGGYCHDTGATTYPVNGAVIGRVKATNTGAGTTALVNLYSPGISATPAFDPASPGPIGGTTPSSAQFTSVNGIPASTLAYIDPTSSIQTQINTNAANIAANSTALSGKAASNAATTVNGVTCTLGGSCTVSTPGLNPKGAWVNSTTYVTGDLVGYLGANYSCITGCAAGVTPVTTANWLPIYGTSVSLSAANTWTALQTFNAGIAGTKASFSQAAPSSSAGFSNFGGFQFSSTNLSGGLTVYDNGSTASLGLAYMFKNSTRGIGLYGNDSGNLQNVFLCPSPTAAPYPVGQASFNCPYTFAATGFTATQPITATTVQGTTKVTSLQAAAANSGAFSNFGGYQTSTTVLNGGLTVLDNGSTWSEGLAAIFKSGGGLGSGVAVYSNNNLAATNVYLCPTASGAIYPVNLASFNCPFVFAATGFSTTGLPINVGAIIASGPTTTTKATASQTAPTNSSGFSNFGANQFASPGLAGGITTADNGSTTSYGMATMNVSGNWGIGLYANHPTILSNVFLCPTASGAPYPIGQASFNCPFTFAATGATFAMPLNANAINANGPVAIAPQSATVPGALTTSDPLAVNQVASSVFVTLAAKTHKDLPGKSLITYSSAYHAFGDSITFGTGATSCTSGGDCYVQVVARGIGATATDFGGGGDFACDAAKKVFNNENPGASGPIYTLMIGTNDSRFKGIGAYETVYKLCHSAALAWLAVQSGSKVAGSTFTGSGFTPDTQYSQVTGTQSTTNGATATGSITTYGGPIYLWYEIIDSNGGTFTYSLNGGPAVSVNAFGPVPIATVNGTTRSVAMLRISPPAAGTQSIAITVTSTTGAGNVVGILAIGTPQQNAYYVGPVVVGASVPYQLYDGMGTVNAQYSLDALTDQQQLAADGLDLRFADIRSCMQDGMTSEMSDTVHPNPTGHLEIATCFIPLLQIAPGRNVNRWTPASSTVACTQSDVWADANYVYACIKSGQIMRAALGAF